MLALAFPLYIITGMLVGHFILPRLNYLIGYHEMAPVMFIWPLFLIRGIFRKINDKIKHNKEDYIVIIGDDW